MKSAESGKDIFIGTLTYKNVKITDERFKECINVIKRVFKDED